MNTNKTSFETILPIWQTKLWPTRVSAIEPMSAMTWPFEGNPQPINISIFDYEPTFWAVYDGDKIVGVNSGHRTTDFQYRSRGIWVDPDYRGKGIADTLFSMLQNQAVIEGCEMIWSIPRKTALKAYTKFGFETVGDFIETETSDANIYAMKRL
jgi:GNAT superfamily N-acetyltransferase